MVYYKENDILCEIFAKGTGLTTKFMRTWLHFFMIDVLMKFFEKFSHNYLASKGLTLIQWAEGITECREGDILALFRLTLLVDKHCLLHLKDSRIWTTILNPPSDHESLHKMCNFHIAHLGRGPFVELKHRAVPLPMVQDTGHTKLIAIGSLTVNESALINNTKCHNSV